MQELATLYRAAQLYAHAAHNLTTGPSFFSDHEFFAECYGAYETAYDSVVERMIGLGMEIDLAAITLSAAEKAGVMPLTSTQEMMAGLLATERNICVSVSTFVPGASDGTQNMLQGLADESEVRQYKIRQRMK